MPYFSMNFKDLRRQGEISLETSGRHRSPHPEAHLDAGLNMMARQGWELREVVQQSDKGPIFIFYKAAEQRTTERQTSGSGSTIRSLRDR